MSRSSGLKSDPRCEWCGSSNLRWVHIFKGADVYNDCMDCGERTGHAVCSEINKQGAKELFIESWPVTPLHSAHRSNQDS